MSREDDLRAKIIAALKEDQSVRQPPVDRCGTNEGGVDITFERCDNFEIYHFYGVQIKSGDITCSSKKISKNIKEIIGQISIAFGTPFERADMSPCYLDGIYLITDGEINSHARSYFSRAKLGFRNIHFVCGQQLYSFLNSAKAKESTFKQT
jgi:hypothetical protein